MPGGIEQLIEPVRSDFIVRLTQETQDILSGQHERYRMRLDLCLAGEPYDLYAARWQKFGKRITFIKAGVSCLCDEG